MKKDRAAAVRSNRSGKFEVCVPGRRYLEHLVEKNEKFVAHKLPELRIMCHTTFNPRRKMSNRRNKQAGALSIDKHAKKC